MFYKLIEKKRDEWLSSPNCKVKDFIDYIVNKGEMRDAQIESIRTYLYLKIACGNKPLWKLFAEGVFNDPDYKLNPAEYGSKTYQTIMNNAGAMALMQYAQPDPKSAPVLPKLKELLRIKAEDIDYFVRLHRYLLFNERDKSKKQWIGILPQIDYDIIERHGDSKGNLIIQGSVAGTCSFLKTKGVYVDMVYLDLTQPRFFDIPETIRRRRRHHGEFWEF